MSHVKPIRSFAKALTWRCFASGMDALVIWKVTGSWKIATGIGIFDVLFKICVYYVHERMWDHISFGKIDAEKSLESDLLNELVAFGGKVDLGAVKVSVTDPFTNKDGSIKNTVFRAKQFKRYEIDVKIL